MSHLLSKKAIRKKTVEIGSLTMASRAFGLLREILLARYLGNGRLSDAFITAFKIPNMLRKFFAEGALSSAFIPTIVHTVRHGKKGQADSLMSIAFIIFQGFVLLLCIGCIFFAKSIIYFMAPGFTPELIEQTVPMLMILMPFLFFISGSALLAGSLQATHHFFIPAVAPVFLNFVFIMGSALGIYYQLPVSYLCLFIILGGLLQFLAHLWIYLKLSFSFGKITTSTFKDFSKVFIKFLVCIPSMSLAEVSLFIDSQFASFIVGGVSSLNYANRFMGIPLGVFATSFASILLPHFSRISSYAPKRLSFYLLESMKLVFWVTIPMTLGMIFFSKTIFHTLFLSPNFPIEQVLRTSNVLVACVLGLFFFSINKILLNIFYASHNTATPTLIAVISTSANIGLNYVLVRSFEIPGLALATTLAAALQTVLSLIFLHAQMKLKLYTKAFATFLSRALLQLATIGCVFLGCFYGIALAFNLLLPTKTALFFVSGIGIWLWVGPLALAAFAALFYSRKLFNVKLYFLD